MLRSHPAPVICCVAVVLVKMSRFKVTDPTEFLDFLWGAIGVSWNYHQFWILKWQRKSFILILLYLALHSSIRCLLISVSIFSITFQHVTCPASTKSLRPMGCCWREDTPGPPPCSFASSRTLVWSLRWQGTWPTPTGTGPSAWLSWHPSPGSAGPLVSTHCWVMPYWSILNMPGGTFSRLL